MNIKNFYRNLCGLINVSWFRSLLFNFRYLPFHQAIKIPILLYHPHIGIKDFLLGGGRVKLSTKALRFGMLKLGVRSQPTCTQKGIWLTNNGTLIFKGATVLGNGCKIEIKAGATLVIGSNTGITGDTIINCHQHITLGDFFSCGWNVSICDTDFHECFHIIEGKKQLMKVCKPITIGNFVWVCQNVTILKGTIIPDWCTIAANSMTKGYYHAEKYSLTAGIPAKIATYKLQRKDLIAIKDIEDFEITKGIKVFG